MLKIFVSSTYLDLEQHRVAVRSVLDRSHDFKAVGMEHFGSGPQDWKNNALKELEECDAFVGIYAYRYGTIPAGDRFSITEQEFERARELTLPPFYYCVNPSYTWDGKWKDTGEQAKRQAEFLNKVKAIRYSVFDSPDNLARKVIEDLLRELPRLQQMRGRPDPSRARTCLRQLVALLREPTSQVLVGQDGAEQVHIVKTGDCTARITPRDLNELRWLKGGADPLECEQAHLVLLALEQTQKEWGRYYVPLKGTPTPEDLRPALRLSGSQAEGLSAGGETIQDIRDVILERKIPRLVIVGEPGAGKTTTLRRLELDLARDRLRDRISGRLPFFVNLYSFVGDPSPSEFLRSQWVNKPMAFDDALKQGQICFLLDGLNQMPFDDREQRIMQWANWLSTQLGEGNWAVFATRPWAANEAHLDLPQIRVQNLDPKRMQEYFRLRLPEHADELWQDFEQRLRSPDDRFERLVGNPFMLSLLVERCAAGKHLTSNRAELMEDLAERLLERELGNENRQPVKLTTHRDQSRQDALRALQLVGLETQKDRQGNRIERITAEEVLAARGQTAFLTAAEFFKLAMDATVLEPAQEGDSAIVFRHHLLQEYFAAKELLEQFRAHKDIAERWRIQERVWQSLRLRTGWEEVVKMTAALAGADAQRFITLVAQDNLSLAGLCLAEVGVDAPDLQALVKRMRAALDQRQHARTIHLRARVAAGLALGAIGHPDLLPRQFDFEGRKVWAILPPLEPVRAGEFLFGTAPGKSKFADEFTTERRVPLDAFHIGRYPVTNAEYRFFIDDDGYKDKNDRWWSDAGREWKKGGADAHKDAQEDWFQYVIWLKSQDLQELGKKDRRYIVYRAAYQELLQLSEDQLKERAARVFQRSLDRPAFWDDPELSSLARPVVGVNWYEADAYCRWLSAVTRIAFQLPSEREWEKAARGERGNEYPWGNKFKSSRCNTIEGDLRMTTPVGLYTNGISPFKIFDASGNVWEWTSSWYEKYPGGNESKEFGKKFRVLRGGAWDDNRGPARCACRCRYVPGHFSRPVGFRVRSPGSIPAF